MTPNVTVISLGGSIIAPKGLDITFLKGFAKLVEGFLAGDGNRKLIIVCGGEAWRATTRPPCGKPGRPPAAKTRTGSG